MKKRFALATSALLAIVSIVPAVANDAYTQAVPLPPMAPCSTVTIAVGSELRADTAKVGDAFPFSVTASGDAAVPVGTSGAGRLTSVNLAKRNSKPADMRLAFGAVTVNGANVDLAGTDGDGTTYIAGGRNAIRSIFTNIPTIGTAMNIRNNLQRGRDLIIPSGTTFCVHRREPLLTPSPAPAPSPTV